MQHNRFEVSLNILGEHHGKGPVEGHFGMLATWLSQFAARSTMKDPKALVHAFALGAKATMKDDPVGSRYINRLFEPGPNRVRGLQKSLCFYDLRPL